MRNNGSRIVVRGAGPSPRRLRVLTLLAATGLALLAVHADRARAEAAYQTEATFQGTNPKHAITQFGATAAFSSDGTTALVYTRRNGKSKGHLWVFEETKERWHRATDLLSNEAVDGPTYGNGSPGFSKGGVALSADGSVALVGGCNESGAGNVLVFTRGAKKWSKVPQRIVGSDQKGNANFGCGVALSGDGRTALVSGDNDDGGVGAVWAFTRNGEEWSQDGEKLTVGTPGFGEPEEFGSAMALSGDGEVALIGDHDRQCGDDSDGKSFCEPFEGTAWTFRRVGEAWTAGEVVSGPAPFTSLSLDEHGNAALLGSSTPAYLSEEEVWPGWAARITNDGSGWSVPAELTGAEEVPGGGFGSATALSAAGDVGLVGSFGNYSSGSPYYQLGVAAWVYDLEGATPQEVERLSFWNEAEDISLGLSGSGEKILLGQPDGFNARGGVWILRESRP
jgi:hypothetical protein